MENKEKNSVSELMETTMTKIREMVDSNSVIGEPITTPDGVTLIPVSRVSLGFGSGGGGPRRRSSPRGHARPRGCTGRSRAPPPSDECPR